MSISPRFRGKVAEVGSVTNRKRPEAFPNICFEHEALGCRAQSTNCIFSGTDFMMFVFRTHTMLGASVFEVGSQSLVLKFSS